MTSDLPLGGNVHVMMQRNGTFTFATHAHDSGFDNISYAYEVVVSSARGDAFTHSGRVEETSAGLPLGTPQRNSDFNTTGQNPAITAKWDDIVASGRLMARLTGQDKLAGALNDLLAEAKAAAEAEIQAVISLIAA